MMSSFKTSKRHLSVPLRIVALLLVPIQICWAVPPNMLLAIAAAASRESVKNSRKDSVQIEPKIKVNRTIAAFIAPTSVAVFSDAPTDQEISHARVFEEPLIPIGGKTSRDQNRLLAQALSAYLKAGRSSDVTPFTHFLEKFPRSAWRAALSTNLGIVYRKTGYFSKALEAWEDAWKLAKDQTAPEARAICDRAAGELAELNSRLGRYERLEPLFAEMGNRDVRGPATEKLLGAKQGLWLMQNKPEDAFRCGPMALARIKDLSNPSDSANEKIRISRSTAKGMSLSQVCDLSQDLELNYKMAKRQPASSVIIPAVVHWKAGHYAALVKESDGRYLIQDPTFGDEIWVDRAALDEEASGYFLVPDKPLPEGWAIVSTAEGEKVWGKGNTGSSDPDRVSSKDRKDPDNDGCNGPGMAYYNVHSLLVSLNLVDTPVGYTPPLGPAVKFRVTYNQRDANQPSIFSYSNLGAKWTFDWLSYVTDDPANPAAAARLYARGGGVEPYTGFNGSTQSYALQPDSHTLLVRTSATSYERRFVDGSKEIYDLPDGASAFPRKVFLSRVVDPIGNSISFSYDSSLRLIAVTDAIGQVTTLSYTLSADPLKITNVTDPFGRFAMFDYNASGQLTKITDTAGITSQFGYGNGDFINTLTTPYGDTTFTYGDTANGGAEGTTRWLEIVDSAGAHERTEYRDAAPGIANSEPVAPTGMSLFNTALTARNSFYWDKKAMQETGGIYPKAKIIHWLHTADVNVTSGVVESQKAPLENRIWNNYPGQPNVYTAGTLDLPSKTGRVLDDGTTQLSQFEYNSLGKVTKSTDPAGRVTAYVYDTNSIDLLEVRQQTGGINELLASFTYNTQHLPLTATDASGQTTTFTYNTAGQIKTITNAKNEVTTYNYDTNGYLRNIVGALPGAIASFTYDGFGRLRTTTDSEGYAVTVDYDAIGSDPTKTLNRVAKVTYPDSSYEQVTYDRLDPEWTRDRLGRWSRKFYDSLRHVVATQDPLNRIITYDWCGCGSLEGITDSKGHTTSWARDIQGRVTDKFYPDRTSTHYTYENTTSRLKTITDAQSQNTNYTYFVDNDLQQVSYTNAIHTTPSLNYTYDPNYNRVATMTDGNGVTTYTYNPVTSPPSLGAARLQAADSPLNNDTIIYSYDELSRVSNHSINGAANAASVQYDSLGRVQNVTNPLGIFNYSYVNSTGRVDHVDYPNGQETQYAYFDNLGDQRLKQIKNLDPSRAVISQFDYTYNPVGNISAWTQANSGATNPRRYDFGYDSADQLRIASLTDTVAQTALNQYNYDYDPAGNRTNTQVGNAITILSANNLNQITSQSSGGKMHFRGTLNEPATVTVGGNPANVDAQANFDGVANVNVGTNTVAVVATDVSGNARTNNYQVNVPSGVNSTLLYDLNGNLTSDGNKTYEWDAANRCTATNQGAHRTEFTYDGASRRVKIVEKDNGSVTGTKQFVWCGSEMCEERDGSNLVTKRYYPVGTQVAGVAYFYTRDHLGSIRELADSNGVVRARYDYDPYGIRTKLSGDLDADFGFTGYYVDSQYPDLTFPTLRIYSANSGRFLSRDPIEEKGGLNLYGYVGNNPSRNVDPLGLSWLDAVSHFDLYGLLNNAAANSYGYGGFWGNTGGIAANLGTTLLDVLGGEQVLDAASRSGGATGCGNYADALSYGEDVIAYMALAAIPGAAEETAALRMTADQIALKELVAEASVRGTQALSAENTRIVMDLAVETKYPGFRASPADLATPSNWTNNPIPHIHLPGATKSGHIPVQWP
jgi:RHS repeat-associated protein